MLSGKLLRLLKWAAWIFLLLTAFVLGIKQLREPDIWWMLRTGEWILLNGRIMKQDIFSFTFEGVPWLNVKWGFEVLLVWLSRIGGPEIILLLQSVANVLLLWFLYKVYNIMRKTDDPLRKRYIPSFSIIASLYLLLFACEFRFNGRPEMVSHVMSAIYLFVLLSWRYYPGRLIYILIPLQILWTNLHEAYGTGMVMMGTFLAASWFEYLYIFKDTDSNSLIKFNKPVKPFHLSIAVFFAFLAAAIHPWGLKMIIHPFEIFSQVQENKFTTELLSYTESGYWHKEAYLNLLIFFFGLFSFVFRFSVPEAAPKNKLKKPKIKWYLFPVSRFSLGYVVLYFMFFYLSLSAYRNIPFFIIIAIPVVARGMDTIYRYFVWKREKSGKSKSLVIKGKTVAYLTAVVFGVVSYYLIISGTFYKKIDDGRDRYGLKVNPVMNPVGAAYFIADNNISGNCFSDFLSSNFLLWQLRPDFKTFIDLRDLDVFPAEFFNKFAYLLYEPQKFEELDSQYNFNYAVLTRNNFHSLHRYFSGHRQWVPAYADAVAAVYLKRSAINNSVIKGLEPDSGDNYKDIFQPLKEWENSTVSTTLSRIFKPSYHPEKDEEINNDLIAADYYTSIGRLEMAMARAISATKVKNESWKGFEKLGDINLEMAANDTGRTKQNTLSEAFDYYNNAFAINKQAENAIIGMGKVKMELQNFQEATEYFKKAVKVNDKNINTYLLLAQIQNYFINSNPDLSSAFMKERIKYLESAYKLDKSNFYIRYHLGIANCQLGKCNECKDYLQDIINFPGVSEQDRQMGKQLLIRCGGSL